MRWRYFSPVDRACRLAFAVAELSAHLFRPLIAPNFSSFSDRNTFPVGKCVVAVIALRQQQPARASPSAVTRQMSPVTAAVWWRHASNMVEIRFLLQFASSRRVTSQKFRQALSSPCEEGMQQNRHLNGTQNARRDRHSSRFKSTWWTDRRECLSYETLFAVLLIENVDQCCCVLIVPTHWIGAAD